MTDTDRLVAGLVLLAEADDNCSNHQGTMQVGDGLVRMIAIASEDYRDLLRARSTRN